MVWLMGRIAWEGQRRARRGADMTLHDVTTILRNELGIRQDPKTDEMVRIGVLLALQADHHGGNARILFGHESFREFLVARYWASQLHRIVLARPRDRGLLERRLLGARLLGEDDGTFAFLCEIVNGPDWDAVRKDLVEWADDCFNDETPEFIDPRVPSWAQDQRPALREAALAIGSTAKESAGLSARQTLTLRAMLGGFWVAATTAMVIAPRLSSPHANLRGANLEDANLEAANLRGANLEGANLEGANLQGADLEGANLSRASLFTAEFGDANLRGAELERANLSAAYLEAADLRAANLDGANLSVANACGANLERANLGGANLGGAYLKGAHFEGASLRGANLRGANLRGANLDGADLDGADLDGASGIERSSCNGKKSESVAAFSLRNPNLRLDEPDIGPNLQPHLLEAIGTSVEDVEVPMVRLRRRRHELRHPAKLELGGHQAEYDARCSGAGLSTHRTTTTAAGIDSIGAPVPWTTDP
jgi:uncharacterized protein YjbI with pentapeptide repeats